MALQSLNNLLVLRLIPDTICGCFGLGSLNAADIQCRATWLQLWKTAVYNSGHLQQLFRRRPSNVALRIPNSSKSCDCGAENPAYIMAPKKQIFKLGSFSEEERVRIGDCALPSEPNNICSAERHKCFQESVRDNHEPFLRREFVSSTMIGSRNLPSKHEQMSFSNYRITHHIISESAIDSNTEDECTEESAIDSDSDSSAWEDLDDEKGKPSVDNNFFQRIELKVDLAPRRSLITEMVANDRAKSLSTSSLPRPQSVLNNSFPAVSLNDSEISSSVMKSNCQLMPVIELSESRQRHLLQEQKTNCRYTSHNIPNSKQYSDFNASQYFNGLAMHIGYNSKGW